MRRRNFNQMNQKLSKVAGNVQPTDEQMKQFTNMASQYKGKSKEEIEAEMNKLVKNFSEQEKKDMIQKLQMLKQMGGLLDSDQRRKVEQFISILSR